MNDIAASGRLGAGPTLFSKAELDTHACESLVGMLDEALDVQPDRIAPSVISDFLASGWIEKAVWNTAVDLLALEQGREFKQDLTQIHGRSLAFDVPAARTNGRELRLQEAEVSVQLIAAQENYALIPLDDLSIEFYALDDAYPADPFQYPSGRLKALRGRTEIKTRGEVVCKTDPRQILVVRKVGKSGKFLLYSDPPNDKSVRLLFDPADGAFAGAAVATISSTKAIGILETLEALADEEIGDVAYELVSHVSPVVRWRALSSLNKVRDARTPEVLLSFCSDPVAFISDAAKQALAKGA